MSHIQLSPDQVRVLTEMVRDSRPDDTELLEAITRPQLVVLNRLDAAFDLWNECFKDSWLPSELATQLTCAEANCFAEFINAFGGDEPASRFLDYHASSDEPGDLHYDQLERD